MGGGGGAPGGVEVELTLANDTMKHDRIPASYRRRQLCGWRWGPRRPATWRRWRRGWTCCALKTKRNISIHNYRIPTGGAHRAGGRRGKGTRRHGGAGGWAGPAAPRRPSRRGHPAAFRRARAWRRGCVASVISCLSFCCTTQAAAPCRPAAGGSHAGQPVFKSAGCWTLIQRRPR